MSKFIPKHWRSTLAGVAMILSAAARVHSLADVSKPEIFGELSGGVGLILCADARKEQANGSTPAQ